ncbi:uncharacterized protein LOC141657963 [Silene latifolia]|uniref:uncharacterized protein LOC141657963 n=1 Tax=Silene latifolia TaxID=37657 RepID=UPI003D785230
MGDFNNVLAMCERIGSELSNYELRDIQECVTTCGLIDIPTTGAFFTWNNKHELWEMVFSRIDRVMITDESLQEFPETNTVFHLERLFDHSPCTINLNQVIERNKECFRYFNIRGKDPEFLQTVQEVWGRHLYGYKMFQLVKKLKMLKFPLKQLNGSIFANIETSAKVARLYLNHVQEELHSDPNNLELQQEVHLAAQCYRGMDEARRSFLAQKAKAQWMNEGAFIDYYKALIGSCKKVKPIHMPTVRNGSLITEAQCQELSRGVTDQEIRAALWAIPAIKAPGPHGFTSQLFRDAYSVVGCDLVEAVKEFFNSGKLLRRVNSSTLTLIPNKNQTLEWCCIEQMLVGLKFPTKVVWWIMACVSTPWFTLSINGSNFGGDRTSKLILRAFATFSCASGLNMNNEKSDIYFNGMTTGEIDYFLIISGFNDRVFTFRYVGIPNSCKRIGIGDCTRLVEKVVAKIRGWGAKNLSYVGRLMLIKAVLTQLHTYWTRIFVIPLTVNDRIEGICINYLWSGSE